MIQRFRELGVLADMGGQDAVYAWTEKEAKLWKRKVIEVCQKKAEQYMKQTLQAGKYGFLTFAIACGSGM